MLTGLINSTSGDAIVKGKKITEAMPEIRKSMGVCPQHDVLFPDLTVAQHLRMFAIFKDVPSAGLEAEVQKIINEVGLTEKRDVASSQLSGGMKRKVSDSPALPFRLSLTPPCSCPWALPSSATPRWWCWTSPRLVWIRTRAGRPGTSFR
jgi:ABC-type nitrate/sulfonate/bicarbonate transport system ATPase subunit